jgi:hypothetical protein
MFLFLCIAFVESRPVSSDLPLIHAAHLSQRRAKTRILPLRPAPDPTRDLPHLPGTLRAEDSPPQNCMLLRLMSADRIYLFFFFLGFYLRQPSFILHVESRILQCGALNDFDVNCA